MPIWANVARGRKPCSIGAESGIPHKSRLIGIKIAFRTRIHAKSVPKYWMFFNYIKIIGDLRTSSSVLKAANAFFRAGKRFHIPLAYKQGCTFP